MSTKTSSKFWKKLGLGKKSSSQVSRPASIQSHATITTTALLNNDDDKSIKSKRFSGVLSNRKQSANSLRRLQQITTNEDPPALPSNGNNTTTEIKSSQTSSLPPVSTLNYDENTLPTNHVELNTPPLDPDLGKQHDELAFDVITHNEARTDEQPDCMTVESNSRSTANQPIPSSATTQRSNMTPSKLMKPKSVSSLKKKSSQADSLTTSSPIQSTINKEPSKSRLRQPSSTPGSARSSTPSASSSTSSLRKDSTTSRIPHRPPIPSNNTDLSSDKKDELIQQLQEALQTEQSINRVLQGQKEAITRDLDYFSLTVDELLEEKESLLQKYEEEKSKALSKEEDLNVLLEKLKTSTDNARERSMEVDQWKIEIQNIKDEVSLEQEELKSALKRKDQVILQLKNELNLANEEINTLSSRLNQLVQESVNRKPTNTQTSLQQQQQHMNENMIIETPSASPKLNAQHYNENDKNVEPRSQGSIHNTNINGQVSTTTTTRRHPSLSVVTTPTLDDELMMLTKEKEKLQSDYSKIPLSGGGPTSRRRKEQLEEMLDEVDSQLSKVKQKIRRS
ncbi:uncharacterized protein BX664DRAFT_319258 [Halteromyces radiatus]|uniref:uncharacterized protein n=1 Tax=Halteromyces radiatus TaxID=101107 RepID=UPI00221F897A|nr:uncharacterized protein BX664DRAFT_319258 [Halteromyces radiatus]KAI8098645.1 hypothetical protein BX664DRAFT_319258 [Halteromyces radiatus]